VRFGRQFIALQPGPVYRRYYTPVCVGVVNCKRRAVTHSMQNSRSSSHNSTILSLLLRLNGLVLSAHGIGARGPYPMCLGSAVDALSSCRWHYSQQSSTISSPGYIQAPGGTKLRFLYWHNAAVSVDRLSGHRRRFAPLTSHRLSAVDWIVWRFL